MKVRVGYVSNSSSSSFIIRKSVLTEEQLNKLRAFFEEHKDWHETEMKEDDHILWGEVAAHSGVNGNAPANILLCYIVDSFQIPLPHREYYDCCYCESVELKDLSDEGKKYIATLKGENYES